jgi:hypothetical protein
MVCLGKAGAALESYLVFPRTALEQVIQNPANPEILLDNGFMHMQGLGGCPEQFTPLLF